MFKVSSTQGYALSQLLLITYFAFIETENVDQQFCLIDDGSNQMKEEPTLDDPCYIEYVEEEMICENPQDDDEETDDGSDYKFSTKFDQENMTKRVKLESIEQEGIIFSCDLCSKTFGNYPFL